MKRTIFTFILLSVYTVAINGASHEIDEADISQMLTEQYESGENRYFYPEMNAVKRYVNYGQLCCHAPCCCVRTREEGWELIENYINSHKKMCQGVEINEESFGPRHVQMIETIKTKQRNDLGAYYQRRENDNPERKCVKIANSGICFLTGAFAGRIRETATIQLLKEKLPSSVGNLSIELFMIKEHFHERAAELCCIACLHSLCAITANL